MDDPLHGPNRQETKSAKNSHENLRILSPTELNRGFIRNKATPLKKADAAQVPVSCIILASATYTRITITPR